MRPQLGGVRLSGRDDGTSLRRSRGEELAWAQQGSCAKTDPELFFPIRSGPASRAAKDVCARCPVIERCLDYALSLPRDPAGIWGGRGQRQRRQMRREASGDSRASAAASGPASQRSAGPADRGPR
ncbi:MAG: WhiB family transcriptional regulator [Mycobacteriales bacterium]